MPDWSSDGYITIETMSSADTRYTNHRSNRIPDRCDYNMLHNTNTSIMNNKDIKKDHTYNINKYTKIVDYS